MYLNLDRQTGRQFGINLYAYAVYHGKIHIKKLNQTSNTDIQLQVGTILQT